MLHTAFYSSRRADGQRGRVRAKALAGLLGLGVIAGVVVSRLLVPSGSPDSDGSDEPLALTKLVESGKRHVLRGKTGEAGLSVALVEYYESHERDTVFQAALAQQLGYKPGEYTVFVLEVSGPPLPPAPGSALPAGASAQSQPHLPPPTAAENKPREATPATWPPVRVEVPQIQLELKLGGRLQALPVSAVVSSTSMQARLLVNAHSGAVMVGPGQRLTRFVAFRGRLTLSDVASATVQINSAVAVPLQPVAESYPIPPGRPIRRRG